MNEENKTRISITIDPDLLEAVRREAEKDERSVSQYINRELRRLLLEK